MHHENDGFAIPLSIARREENFRAWLRASTSNLHSPAFIGGGIKQKRETINFWKDCIMYATGTAWFLPTQFRLLQGKILALWKLWRHYWLLMHGGPLLCEKFNRSIRRCQIKCLRTGCDYFEFQSTYFIYPVSNNLIGRPKDANKWRNNRVAINQDNVYSHVNYYAGMRAGSWAALWASINTNFVLKYIYFIRYFYKSW